MANPIVEKNVLEILGENLGDSSKNMALASAWIIANFKGVNIKIFNTAETSSLCNYNIIASIQNTPQANTICDEIQFNLKKHADATLVSFEAAGETGWLLMDFGDVIIHLFQEEARDMYNLEDIWKDSPTVEIPNNYYFGNEAIEKPKAEEDTYF